MAEENRINIVIALDPTEAELRPGESSVNWLRNWTTKRNSLIDAVYISTGEGKSPTAGQEYFSDYVKSLNLGKEVRAKVLNEPSTSRRKAVDRLVHYAREINSDFIAVASHGRSGPGRLVLGSFAESLLASSPIPILFLNDTKDVSSSKILFATDLSESSRTALDLFLDEMKGYSGELVLFHAVSPPGAIFDTGIMGVPVYLPESYWLEQKQWTERECDLILKSVKSKGFNVRMVVQDGVLNTPAAIEKCAQDENVGLIGMASVSRGLESAVIGSVAKEIFRSRRWPVWVCGPEAIVERTKS